MKRNSIYKGFAGAITALLLSIGIGGCNKTEYEQLKQPYNDIEHFTLAGYNDLDSINGVIVDNEIIVYWNADVEHPETIRPTISISPAATISPASGEEVAFSESTVYTVTAEDGTARSYQLKPVFNETIPKLISAPALHEWRDENPISITGEYFLAVGDFSTIKVYGMRIRDGFEFDIPIDEEQSSSTKLVVNLPKLTAELDTGAHRIYVKVGEFESNYMETWLYSPGLNYVFEDDPIIYRHGDLYFEEDFTFEVTVKEGMEEIAARYYNNDNLTRAGLSTYPLNGYASTRYIPTDKMDIVSYPADYKYVVKLSEEVFGEYADHTISAVALQFPRIIQGQTYNVTRTFEWNYEVHQQLRASLRRSDYVPDAALVLEQEGQQLSLGQELTINYTFGTETLHNQFARYLSYVWLVVRDEDTGIEQVIRLDDVTNDSEQAKITATIPSDRTDVQGKTVTSAALEFYRYGTGYSYPRVRLNNTTIN